MIEDFLNPHIDKLYDPFRFVHMSKAVDLLYHSVRKGEGVLIYGDYDVDGIASISLLRLAFESMGMDLSYFIPHRLSSGYGLSMEDIDNALENNIKLIITVDCGISSIAETDYARSKGIKMIITDHHEISQGIPRADAVINPKDPDGGYPFQGLAGVGVAFKLLCGFCQRYTPKVDPLQWIDLVALGTVADIAPIIDENRIIVKRGLELLNNTSIIGLTTLFERVRLKGKKIGPGHISYTIAPKINATGRVGEPMIGVKLLCTKDVSRASKFADQLMECNYKRQAIEKEILAQALEKLEQQPEKDTEDIIVLAHENWHIGVIGIVSSILKDRYHRPVILISIEGNEGRGSGRSIDGFSLYDLLSQMPEYLIRYGGHDLAVGLAVEKDKIPQFKKQIRRLASERMKKEMLENTLSIDASLNFSQISRSLVDEIEQMQPYGPGNRPPLFITNDCNIIKHKRVGYRQQHLWIVASQKKHTIEGIGFGLGHLADIIISPAQNFDLLYDLAVNKTPRKGEHVQLRLKNIRSSDERYFAQMFMNRQDNSDFDDMDDDDDDD
jgi:single-stranded-DNA-specific exonuclease